MSPDVKLFPRSVFTGETAAGGPNSPHYVLLSTQNSNSPSQADSESNFTDGSDTLFSMYNDKTAEYDRKLAENWREDANGVMILSGLFSATVAGFLSQSYLTSQTSSQDVSAFYLGQIYQLQASSNNNTNVTPLAVPPTTAPTPTIAHALWFASLVLSLSSAVFATLVQEWVRRYLLMTQPRSSPHRRARIRAFITQEGSLVTLQRTVNSLHSFLHLSIFFFLLGLIALASNFGGPLVLVVIIFYTALPVILYLVFSLAPFLRPHALYSTPFSGFLLWFSRSGRSLLRTITRRRTVNDVRRDRDAPLELSWLTLDDTILEVEKRAETHSASLDIGAMSWLLNSLSQEQELEQFLAGIPGFYKSTRVEDPAQVLRKSNTDRFPRAIVSFIDRSLSSDLISDSTRQQRIRVSLKAIQTDPYLLQRTFHHALCSEDSAIFKCIEFVLMAERYTDDEDPNVQFLARCIVAVAITRIADHDLNERWSGIVRRRLNLSGSDLTAFGKQRDNLLLRNLVQLVRELNTAHPDYDEPGARVILDKTLNAVRQMKVEHTSLKVQSEFCELWNRLVDSSQDLERDAVLRSNAMRILSLIRTIYIPLHEGPDSRFFAYSTFTNDPFPTFQRTLPYPLCTVPAHAPSNRATSGGGVSGTYDTGGA